MRCALITLLLLAGCRHTGAYVWADQFPEAPRPAGYQVVVGDLLFVRVLGHDDMSGRVRVRSDGRISIPVLQDVPAAGMTPGALADTLRDGLKDYVSHPVVTVTVEEPRPLTVSVTGEVVRPGVYPLEMPAGVLQALASPG